jgi:peptidoglycan/xylan/chitin deacetylase (PgdA/CDA1 family)
MNPWLIGAPALTLAAVAGATAYSAVYPRSQIFGKTICRTNSPRKLAITFDDGPNPAITPQLLDLLERYKAHATFFVVGKFVRECPELLLETSSRGHVIGNHTDAHPNLFLLSPDRITVELRCCNSSIGEAIGAAPKWFRPPYGMRNPWVIPTASELGMSTVMWTRIPGDWSAKSTEWLIPRMDCVAEHARANIDKDSAVHGVGTGDILCLHDGDHAKLNGDRTRTLAALEHWLPRWRDLGLEFVTIDEAVSTPAL